MATPTHYRDTQPGRILRTNLKLMTSVEPVAVAALLTRARHEVDEGLLPACQLALALHGEVVVNETFGDAAADTRFTMFSATKPLVASVVWQLMGEGLINPATRIAEVLPDFGTHGKDEITLDHLLQHTSGLPRAPLGPPLWESHEGRRSAFSKWRLNWPVGSQFEYRPTSAHWVLAEVIYALTGDDHIAAVRQRLIEPLGLGAFVLGPPLEAQTNIATLVATGDPASPDEIEAVFGMREIDVGEVTEEATLSLNLPEVRSVGIPGGGGVSTAADVAMFYQSLLTNAQGLWDPVVLADATSTVRNTFPDPMLGYSVNRTRGLVVAGDGDDVPLRGMGRTVSSRAFGHNGVGGQLAWADPATGLSFCYLTNGLDRNVIRQSKRGSALGSLAAVCAS